MDELFKGVTQLIDVCRDYGLYSHPKICIMFTSKVRWCGRIITNEGVLFDLANYRALCKMKTPETAAKLHQFSCALQ